MYSCNILLGVKIITAIISYMRPWTTLFHKIRRTSIKCFHDEFNCHQEDRAIVMETIDWRLPKFNFRNMKKLSCVAKNRSKNDENCDGKAELNLVTRKPRNES